MKKFSNFRRKSKIAIALFSVLFGGNISSANDMNCVSNQNVRLSQTTRKIEATSITNKKLFKPLVATVAALLVGAVAGFTIWGLTRNKKESATPKKEDDNKGNIKSEIQGEKSKKEINEQNNKGQITKEKGIEEHNKNLICNAIALAKKENKLHCDEDSLKNAMFELFGRLANIKYENKAWGVVSPLWKFFHEKKIPNISIGEYESENYVFLHTGEEHDYSIVWLPDNKVAIGFMDLGQNWEQTFENLKSPFEVKN